MHAEKQDKEFKYNEAQVLNYLRTIEIEIALLFKFERQPEIRRKAFNN
jgi:hypothetical protein